MCLGGGGDDGAERARQEEIKRQQMIQEANAGIDKAFAGFNPEFYSTAEKSYLDYYLPQLDEQYAKYKRQQVLGLADTGNLASTTAGRFSGELQDTYNRALEKIKNDAIAYGTKLRGSIADSQSDLRSMAAAGISPGSIAKIAGERSLALAAPPAFDPLSDFFASIAAQQANRNIAKQQGYDSQNPLLFNSNANNSVRTVS